MNNVVSTNPDSQLGGLQKYGMLLMGIFLIILSGGRFVTPSAAFLAPIFLLRFTRNTSFKTGLVLLYVLLFLSLMVRLHDYVTVPRPMNLLLIAGFAFIEVLPFAIDRKLYSRLPAFLTPFVLPVCFVVLGFVASRFLPFGTMGERAYTQVGNQELMQLLSVTGTHGITFVIFWFAVTMASLWDAGFVWRRCRSQVLPLSLVLMIIFVSGGFRNIFDENESATVRIAGVIADQSELVSALQAQGVPGETVPALINGPADKVNAVLDDYHQGLFARTKAQALSGAEIVAWGEASAVVFKSREAEFLDQLVQVASDNEIYLVATLNVMADPDNSKIIGPRENKLLVVGPDGTTRGQYSKSKYLWSPYSVDGDDAPLLVDTEYGNIAFAIGFDLDFPASIRRAKDIDIIIAPSSDWKTLAPHHSLMATFRAVENGASLFRPTNKGLSIASDSHGRILAQTDHFRTTQHSMVADVPTGGVDTFYSKAGDWFAYLCMVFLGVLLAAAYYTARRRKAQPKGGDADTEEQRRAKSRITAIQWRDSERDNNLHRNE